MEVTPKILCFLFLEVHGWVHYTLILCVNHKRLTLFEVQILYKVFVYESSCFSKCGNQFARSNTIPRKHHDDAIFPKSSVNSFYWHGYNQFMLYFLYIHVVTSSSPCPADSTATDDNLCIPTMATCTNTSCCDSVRKNDNESRKSHYWLHFLAWLYQLWWCGWIEAHFVTQTLLVSIPLQSLNEAASRLVQLSVATLLLVVIMLVSMVITGTALGVIFYCKAKYPKGWRALNVWIHQYRLSSTIENALYCTCTVIYLKIVCIISCAVLPFVTIVVW